MDIDAMNPFTQVINLIYFFHFSTDYERISRRIESNSRGQRKEPASGLQHMLMKCSDP